MDHWTRITKGHATQNDFVLYADPDGHHPPAPELVRALCDRRAGVGADGLIRAVRCDALADGVAQAAHADWFMDYRNADGTTAQMCGNGIRVFVRFLLARELAAFDAQGTLTVGTRSGPVRVRADGELLVTELGAWSVPGGSPAVAAGGDVQVSMPGEPGPLPGLRVLTGNPHVVVALGEPHLLGEVGLDRPPRLHPELPDGANVEVVVPLPVGPGQPGRLLMRVHERGVGETRSCGSGAVAAVIAARAWACDGAADGEPAAAPSVWWVDVPGGRLRVRLPEPGAGGTSGSTPESGPWAELAGPAVLVADFTLTEHWLDDQLTVP